MKSRWESRRYTAQMEQLQRSNEYEVLHLKWKMRDIQDEKLKIIN